MALKPPTARPPVDDEWETVAEGGAAADDWETVEDAPEKSDGSGALATGGALAGLGGLIAGARPVANTLATLTTQVAKEAPRAIGFTPRAVSAAAPVMETVASPLLKGASAVVGKAAAPLNAGMALVDYLRGKRSLTGAVMQGGGGYAATRYLTPDRLMKGAQAVQRVATPAAEALGGAGALTTAGGLAGVGGLAAFLGALQHDANRDVPMDYTKPNLTEDIARVLGGTGATDAQMDDPSHPAFRADDSATVTAGEEAGLVAALRRLLRGGA